MSSPCCEVDALTSKDSDTAHAPGSLRYIALVDRCSIPICYCL